MPFRSLCLALVVAFVPAPSAQVVNTEKLRLSDDVDGLNVDLASALAYATGNVDYLQLGLGGRVDYRRDRDAGFVTGNLAFQRAEGRTFLNDAFAHARYNRQLTGLLTAELFVQTQRSEAQLLERRYLAGAGLRADLLRDDDLRHAEEQTRGRGRLSSYLTTRLALGDVVALTNTVYVQPAFDNPDDVRIFDEVQLDLGVTRYVKVRTRVNVRHDSRPPADLDPTDVTVTNGVAVVFPVR